MRIYDNTFLQAISCPLKVYHLASEQQEKNKKKVSYRHRNKLRLRDVISLQYENQKFTSDSIRSAEEETESWLKEESVAICGAVLRSGNLVTRIPILVKNRDHFTLIQVHGKLRKRVQGDEIQWPVQSRSTASYLLKAAYRSFVLLQSREISSLNVTLYFPNRAYRSTEENLLHTLSGIREAQGNPDSSVKADDLFAAVDATDAARKCMENIPESVSHPIFVGKSVEEACRFIEEKPLENGNILDISIHKECKYCEFRRETNGAYTGCWNQFFPDKNVELPDLHVYELIGHGNDEESEKGYHYQEQVPATEPYSSFENIQQSGGKKFTIHQRRMLQLLKSKGEPEPNLWVRSGLRELGQLSYPLHFLDFEAATYALPLERGEHPYHPVYFQYSCHTLHEDGSLVHHHWLDEDAGRSDVHESLVDHLTSIDGIEKGCIVQYSQFEYRALKNILNGLRKNANLHKERLKSLKEVMDGLNGKGNRRFLDLSRIIEEYYYNQYMQGSIGLKHVLQAVLKWQKSMDPKTEFNAKIYDISVDFYHSETAETYPDPYSQLSLNGEQIEDGSQAMNAWLSLKNGLLTAEESITVPLLLKRYCALDSYALVILYRHLSGLTEQIKDDEDLILVKDLDNTTRKP